MNNSVPKYSVCICNYNMADTIERALTSVLDQLDDSYEVLLVDDGSSDSSVSIVKTLMESYDNLRLIELERDSNRQLGITRNLSIKEAKGEYVILHVDSDDVWEPYIPHFVSLAHKLETAVGHDILVSGQQINIGRRDFLLKHGPYRNTHRAQDRDMWHRLAALNAYFPVDHVVFRTRLDRPTGTKLYRIVRNTWYQMLYDMRQRTRTAEYVVGCFTGIFRRNEKISYKTKFVRFALALPVFIRSRMVEPLLMPENMKTHAEFVKYRELNRGTFPELFSRFGYDADLSHLNDKSAERIFSQKR